MTAGDSGPSLSRPVAEPIDPVTYSAFIGQTELSSIWRSSSSVRNPGAPGPPWEASIDIAGSAHRESSGDGFVAFHAYDVKIEVSDSEMASISVTFGLEFKSEQAISEE